LIVVPLSFLVAGALAAMVLVTLGLEHVTQAAKRSADGEFGEIQVVLDLLWQGSILASGASILPALAVVIVGEVARIRSAIYYMAGGGIALAAIPLLSRFGTTADILPPTIVWQVLATAGFVGGWVYWFLAGRRA
jgi:hypothetical protein